MFGILNFFVYFWADSEELLADIIMYHCSTGMHGGCLLLNGCYCSWFVFPMTQNDLQKYEVRIKSLQAHSEQQSKVLKRKTEEVCSSDLYTHVLACNTQPLVILSSVYM